MRYVPPEGGYLAWLDCRELGLGDDPAAAFLERGRVALSPGPTFGEQGKGFARLNFGTSRGAARGSRRADGGHSGVSDARAAGRPAFTSKTVVLTLVCGKAERASGSVWMSFRSTVARSLQTHDARPTPCTAKVSSAA